MGQIAFISIAKSAVKSEDYESLLSHLGYNLDEINWMVSENPQIVKYTGIITSYEDNT